MSKLKLFSLWMLLIMLTISFGVTLTLAQFGSSGTVCLPFMGASTSFNGATVNEGQLNFNNANPSDQYKGCVLHYLTDFGTNNDYVLQGWVWNENLGWISMGAFDTATVSPIASSLNKDVASTGATNNLGIQNGTVKYSSILNVTRNVTTNLPIAGELLGYWWGDNAGWIRLNCEAYIGLAQCAVPYGVKLAPLDTTNPNLALRNPQIENQTVNGQVVPVKYYSLTGYGWSDNIGWVNMAGVKIPIDSPSANPPEITLVLSKDAVGEIISDGNSGYNISFRVEEAGENVTKSFHDFVTTSNTDLNQDNNVTYCLLFKDNRKLDSTPGATTNTGLGVMDDCKTDPNIFKRFGHDATKYIRNSSTTTASNFSFVEGNATTTADDKIVANTKIKSYVPAKAGENLFEIVGFELKVGTAARDLIAASPLELDFNPSLKFKFLPGNTAVEAVSDCSDYTFTDFKFSVGIPVSLQACGRMLGSRTIFSVPEVMLDFENDTNIADSIELKFQRVVDENGDPVNVTEIVPVAGAEPDASPSPETGTPGSYILEDITDFTFSPISTFYSYPFRALITFSPEGDTGDTTDISEIDQSLFNLGVSSKLKYNFIDNDGTTKTVIYPGPVLSQAMFSVDTINVFGGFGDRAFTQVSSGRSTSSGVVSRSVIRSKLIKNIYDVVSVSSPLSGNCKNGSTTLSDSEIENCRPNSKVQMFQLSNTTESRKVLNYQTLRAFFAASTSALYPTPRTLILVGYDLVINDNISPTDANLPAIVLLTNKLGKGGNVYITSDVTEVSGYIYADKSFMSVDDVAMANDVSANGVPTEYLLRDYSKLYNDIVFVGRFWAENCVGCALGNPPTKGDGSIAANITEAQPYDFNYFRMSSIRFTTAADAGGRKFYVDCTGELLDVEESEPVPNEAKCWRPPSGALSSEYLYTLREDAGESDYRSVNFVSKDAANLPILGGL